jgi:hypothetical protein
MSDTITATAVAVLVAFFAAPAISQTQQHDIEHLVVEMANTAQEHQAVAQHYRMKATEARGEGQRHEQMGRVYASKRSATLQRGQHPCDRLAAKFREMATDYEELAKLHDELSQNPTQ